MGKYIIELERGETAYKTVNSNGKPMIQLLAPTPYTEPDLDAIKQEEYEKGYKTAKVQCNIQTEKDLREVGRRHYQKGYRRALADVREEHVCQTCVYFERDENEEPCVRCPRNFIDQYMPKQEQDAEIRVGDEVRNGKNGWAAVVVRIRDDDCLTLMDDKGAIADGYEITKFVKTGRHFPEIAEVLEKMRKDAT